MRSYRVEGIVIKRKNFGEADRILTVFTKQKGKIQLMAKGVRRITSKRSSHIELLNYCTIGVYEGRMLLLTEAECLNHHSDLKNDLRRAGYAFYICELVDGLLAEYQENREIFNLLSSTLFALEKSDSPKELIKRFEEELLTLLGFWSREQVFLEDSSALIEDIMEKKIKTRKILLEFS